MGGTFVTAQLLRLVTSSLMRDNFQIVAEINTLIQQQADALKGRLGVLEATEYANRAKRIHELFRLLDRGPRRGSETSK